MTTAYVESVVKIADDELLRRLRALLSRSRRVEIQLIVHMAEVDRRRLYARWASSMFTYCTEVLHLSEQEAYLRIEVGRASRSHAALLTMIADGRLHLSGITLLRRYLTEANGDLLLRRAVHKSKRQIEQIVAEISPQRDVPPVIRKLPERQKKVEESRAPPDPERVEPRPVLQAVMVPQAPTPLRPAAVTPIAPARYKVLFTASAELRDKLERLRALMRPSVPDGDLATIIDDAVTEKLERLESKRFGKTKAPRKTLQATDTSPSSRYIPAAVKRTVYLRDQGRCTFVDESGRRCTERYHLEFHHKRPYRRGGHHDPSNLRLLCRTHNAVMAERDYGKSRMAQYRGSPDRVSEPEAAYIVSLGAT